MNYLLFTTIFLPDAPLGTTPVRNTDTGHDNVWIGMIGWKGLKNQWNVPSAHTAVRSLLCAIAF